MRIGISGPACSGKSTLATFLSQSLKYPHISEVARSILQVYKNLGLSLDDLRKDKDVYKFFQRSLLYSQLAAEKALDKFVSDRTVYDILVYSYIVSDGFVKEIEKTIEMFHDGYDLIIYCEPLDFEEDGIRAYWSDEIEMFEKIVKRKADLILPSDMTPEERLRKVIEVIK